MEFLAKSGHPEKQQVGCVIVAVFESRRLSAAAARLDEQSGGYLSALLRSGDLEGKIGQTLLLHQVPNLLCKRVLLMGCGKEREIGEKQYQQITSKMIAILNDIGANDAVSYLTELNLKGRNLYFKIRYAIEAIYEVLYEFNAYKTKKEATRRHLKRLTFALTTRRELQSAEAALQEGVAISRAIQYTKDLGNQPPNVCNPGFLATEALKLASEFSAIEVSVLEKRDMEALKMGCLLAVGGGSSNPPKLITLQYRGLRKDTKPIVLIGKGVTFDSGGHSLKPLAGMLGMKYDMSGAGTVLGVFKAAALLKLPIHLVGVIPAVENLPGPTAYRPDDILTSMSGQTVEVLNTDAEGRLILCDAITYAERYNPECVIDIATLTGACIMALGNIASGLYSNHQPLGNELFQASQDSWDRAWHMPLWDDYHDALESKFADMANVGTNAGSVVAACFLSKFAKKMNWAHLDVAGTACIFDGKAKGATGRPIPLLVQFLLNRLQG